MVACGVLLLGWIIFSIATGINGAGKALVPTAFAAGLLYVGTSWVRGQVAK